MKKSRWNKQNARVRTWIVRAVVGALCLGMVAPATASSQTDADRTASATDAEERSPSAFMKRYMKRQVVYTNRVLQQMIQRGATASQVSDFVSMRLGKVKKIQSRWEAQLDHVSEELSNRLKGVRNESRQIVALPKDELPPARLALQPKRMCHETDAMLYSLHQLTTLWQPKKPLRLRSRLPLRRTIRPLIRDAEAQMRVHQTALARRPHARIQQIHTQAKALLDARIRDIREALKAVMSRTERAHRLSLRMAHEAIRRRDDK